MSHTAPPEGALTTCTSADQGEVLHIPTLLQASTAYCGTADEVAFELEASATSNERTKPTGCHVLDADSDAYRVPNWKPCRPDSMSSDSGQRASTDVIPGGTHSTPGNARSWNGATSERPTQPNVTVDATGGLVSTTKPSELTTADSPAWLVAVTRST